MRRDPELALQQAVWRLWERRQAPRCFAFHPANEGKRGMNEALDLKLAGVVAGVPDLVFTRSDGWTAYIELKTGKVRLSEDQLRVQAILLNTRAGYAVCRSVEEVEAQLLAWRLILP